MPSDIARLIDHTLLKPEATRADVDALIAEAAELGTYSVCVSPSMLPVVIPEGSDLKVAVVCGFPSGKHTSAVKAAEAAESVSLGADEIDMVIDIGAAKAGDFDSVERDIAAVRAAAPAPTVLKVIIESAALTDDEIVAVSKAAESAGAEFVKTSTGFHPTGGATEHAVALMAATVAPRLGVKASGGVRSLDDARRMVAAGATRLGVSGSRAMLAADDTAGAGSDTAGY
ncbi:MULTISPECIES: deoxyribose-phosphate aldolase [unclassified Frondihabitans]|uniref:deoxyribose-phosphate aldolase n=1 Tax=unclassified Frondihabitans TaxID=2626248 RepID=UPI0006F33E89|nr:MULTISPECIES: deoxyribose-phosphate aldolase [unclassified Frondihabitans]KQQ26665.1 2-deoxyribose-5-phosphate aldolase [Frondihabitans sp. Leaf304]RPE76306.1 deoxyribose-phosphate aldolase [Frondihabitans sp. PhB153]RPF05418.1 deoxyribose-phosphate aldolase [Frondihabitans sp. PhB161]